MVLVRPGEYRERLKIDKHVELVGMGPTGSVVVIGFDGPAVEATGRITSLRDAEPGPLSRLVPF